MSPGFVAITGLGLVRGGTFEDLVRAPAGRYAATVHLIERDQQPAAVLPDFVVTLTPETTPGTRYRTSVECHPRSVRRRRPGAAHLDVEELPCSCRAVGRAPQDRSLGREWAR